jgi:hypothetical protein
VYLHIDSRVSLTPFARALSAVDLHEVVLLRRRATRWGSVEAAEAGLDGLARSVADGCSYFVLISGQDFPLRPVDEILAFFEEAGTRSYVEHWPLPTPRWRFGGRDRTDFYTYTVFGRRETCVPRGVDVSFFNWKGRILNELLRLADIPKPPRRFPPYVRPFGGWAWWNLSRPAANHVLQFVAAHPDYRDYHRYTLSADEVFVPSIILGTDYAKEHEVVNDSLRFTIWPEGASHPLVLGERDLPAMLESEKLFARKFDVKTDGLVLTRLAERVTT